MSDKERIKNLEDRLETAKLRLCGGVDSTNQNVDLTPTVEETVYYSQRNYHGMLKRLAGGS